MKYLSLFIIIFFFAQQSNGQFTPSKMGSVIDSLRYGKRTVINKPICSYPVSDILDPMNIRLSDLFSTPPSTKYISTMGFFCKQELKLDKITPMPVRFRLGSLDYVNWLERKPNATYNR